MKTQLIVTRMIVTDYDPPPVWQRDADWSAVRDNYEPRAPVGYGRTEREAILDLLDKELDRDE